jgi:uncharacterized membrane protein (UPF0127 family)
MVLYRGSEAISMKVETAGSFIRRFAGLIGKKKIPAGYCLYFPGCNSIHTFFMSMAIDVIMTSAQGRVEGLFPGILPWKFAFTREAADTIEAAAGTIAASGIKKGDILHLKQD